MKTTVRKYPENTIQRHVAGSAISSDDVVRVGARWGIAVNDIANGDQGIVETRGRHLLAKASGAIALGATLWWDSGNSRVTATQNDGPPIGVCAKAALTGDTAVEVDLNERNEILIRHVVTSAEDTANVVAIDLGGGVDPWFLQVTIESVADPSVQRLPASIDVDAGTGVITVAHASLAVNEVIHVHAAF